MAINQNSKAPYATAASVLDILERLRNRGLPTPINKDVLIRSGVSESLVPRTLQALHLLDLIDRQGNPSDTFEGLRLASEADYKACFTEWLKSAYAEVFAFVDPTTDSETEIRDAFRSYAPHGQQDRMVALFIGLCTHAGLREGVQKEVRAKSPAKKPSVRKIQQSQTRKPAKRQPADLDIPPAIMGLLDSLPSVDEGWTQERRDNFTNTLGTLIDFFYPIKGPNEESTPESREAWEGAV